jgi:hypothetical protein
METHMFRRMLFTFAVSLLAGSLAWSMIAPFGFRPITDSPTGILLRLLQSRQNDALPIEKHALPALPPENSLILFSKNPLIREAILRSIRPHEPTPISSSVRRI